MTIDECLMIDWMIFGRLLKPAAGAVLGCTQVALFGRATRGKVPYVVHDHRRWFRPDLLELLVRADVATMTGQI